MRVVGPGARFSPRQGDFGTIGLAALEGQDLGGLASSKGQVDVGGDAADEGGCLSRSFKALACAHLDHDECSDAGWDEGLFQDGREGRDKGGLP
jgi:hypothetical protein